MIGVYISDENGEVNIDPIEAGPYYIEEITPPEGYVIDKNFHKDVVIKSDEQAIVSFSNEKRTTVEVFKVDGDTNEFLKGANIRIALDGGHESFDLITDANGRVFIEDLKSGTYTISETVAPQGYILNTTKYPIKLVEGQDHSMTIKNHKKPGILIKKYDEGTSLPLGGAEFSIAHKGENGGSIVHEGMVDENGLLHFEGLDEGWYTIKEIAAPDGYLIATKTKDVFLPAGKSVEVKFDNRKRPALELVKLDEKTKQPLAGAKFKVTQTENKTVSEYVTGTDGKVFIEKLDEEIYSVEEIVAPDGYILEPQHKDILLEWGKTKTLIFTNKEKPKLEILKIDSVTKKPIENAKFKVEKVEDKTVSEYTTNSEGKILLEKLDEAIYKVFETIPADGYIINPTTKDIATVWGTTKQLIFENTKLPTLIITKINSMTQKPIPNTTYTIEYENPSGGIDKLGTFKTDANGQIIIPKVKVGWYSIEETIPAQGMSKPSNPIRRVYLTAGENSYLATTTGTENVPNAPVTPVSPQSVQVTYGNNYINAQGEIIENYPLNSIVIKKIDAITSEALENGVFEVKKIDGQQSGTSGTIIGRYNTDTSGVVVITGLEAGQYIIEEVKAPSNYLISENSKQTTSLKADGTSVVEVTFENFPYGHILVSKIDAQTGKPLANARFKVTDGQNAVAGNSNGEFITDENGEFKVSNLKPSTYVITELEAPENYVIDTTPQTITVGTDGKVYKVSFKNQPVGKLVIKKYNSVTKEPLAEAEFKVTTSKGDVVGTGNGIYKTDEKGTIEIPNLPKGSYVAQEIKAPLNFILEQQTQTVDIEYGKTHVLDFYNKPMSSIQIIKIDSETKKPLKDAKFTVYKKNGESLGDFITDGNGLIMIPNLEPNWYKIQETKAPDGYLIDEIAKDVELTSNQFLKVTFENKKLTSLVIKKTDDKTGEPLGGAMFVVERQNGEHVGEYTTDKDGVINIPILQPDWYIVREKKSPAGYWLDETPKTIEIKTNVPTVITFTNKKLTALEIIKVDEKSNEPLNGAIFKVEKQNGERIGEFTTADKGIISIPTLLPDFYVVTEIKAPTGYLLDGNPQIVEVKSNTPTVVKFTNKKLTSLEILKIDEKSNEPLNGAIFSVSKQDGEFVGEFTTADKGIISIPTLDPDFYVIKELKAPKGYLLDEKARVVEIKTDVPTIVKFTNKKLTALEIIKIDEKSNEPLNGAVFAVERQNGERIGEWTTADKGVILIPELTPDFYIVKEIKSPDGYMLDESPKTVEIKTDTPTVVKFTNKKLTSLQIKKIDEITGKALIGAVFTIEKQNGEKIQTNENGTEWTTDAQGFINIPTLAPDFYIVREVKSPDGYLLETTPKTVEVKTDSPTVVTFTNRPLSGLRIIKLNSENKKPIEGTEFIINKMDGGKVENDFRSTTFKTDKTGQIFIPKLENGYYLVTETKASEGYILNSEPRTVLVETGKTTLLEVENTPASGLLIVKTDLNTKKPLMGVKFSIKKADGQRVQSSLLDKNQPTTENNSPNKTTTPNGDISGVYTTDANGRILINYLAVGEYNVVELEPLKGYELDTDVHSVTVTAGKQAVLEVTNKPLSGLKILKIDSITKEPIFDVEFMVFDQNGKVVGNFYTDNMGVIDFSAILTEGRYTIRETRPAENYYKDDVPRTVEFIAGKVTEIVWENVPKGGQVQILKLSANDNELNGLPENTPLQGAIFEVYAFKSGNLVDRFITGNDGKGVSKPLPLGRYSVREVQAPQYYKLSKKVLDIEIEFATQIIKLDFTNESANIGVSIDKVGPKEVMIKQQTRYDIKKVRNDSTVALTDFYWRDILPVDAVRLDKIVTGTYNQSLKYKIMATTNKGNTMVIADNLMTTKNNVIDCSNASLGLGNDEFVANFTVYFGNVKAGFTSVDEPKVYVTVLNKALPNGYKFANKAEVGGKYQGEWIIGNSSTVCIIYNSFKGKLPKTGF